MIEKIIENWLTKASEKSYQLPFCFLLSQQDKTILHMTRHSSMEQGKDIIAVDNNGQLYVYQLKGLNGGRLTISAWQRIQHQVSQMALTPCSHPSANTKKYHRSYLVVNGDIDEEVQHAITMFNNNWERQGHPQYRIHTIVKGELLKMALEAKGLFLPEEAKNIKALLEFYLEDGTGFLDKEAFATMLKGVVKVGIDCSYPERKRLISSGALVCSLATASYQRASNHIAIIEAWVLYLFRIFYCIESVGLNKKEYENEIEITQQIILNTLKDLSDEVISNPEMLQGDLLTDAFIFRYRITLVVGFITALGLIDKIDEKVDRTLLQLLPEATLWGESAIPYSLVVYFKFLNDGKTNQAVNYLKSLFQTLMENIFVSEKTFSDIYHSPDAAIASIFNPIKSSEDFSSPRLSYTLEVLVELLAMHNERDFLSLYWPQITHCIYSSIQFNQTEDFYEWRNEDAEHVNKHPQSTQSWNALHNQAMEYNIKQIPKCILGSPNWMPLFLLVLPHRTNTNIVKWYAHFLLEKQGHSIAHK